MTSCSKRLNDMLSPMTGIVFVLNFEYLDFEFVSNFEFRASNLILLFIPEFVLHLLFSLSTFHFYLFTFYFTLSTKSPFPPSSTSGSTLYTYLTLKYRRRATSLMTASRKKGIRSAAGGG